ncbi:ferritin [Kribbella amoyensis]|uniref:Ferritin n=1 Tax=Kribbella amoyensis TaxID=996641 RepID=A0A561BZN7_9ACTN|nr:ferritin [Kribbella amoyensis]TWD84288.1 ferritin [Kribbella amoyensis]
MSTYVKLLQEQIRNEFTASQQYTAVAVWYDDQDLPQLAGHFYKQALEERNHAMMMVQYLLDKDIQAQIPGVEDVVNDFDTALAPLELALQQEITVTKQIETLARTARDEGDYVGEQFMQWFLKEQVEEVSAMTTLVNVAKRAGDNLFHLEDFLAREVVGDQGADPTAPTAAGGSVQV